MNIFKKRIMKLGNKGLTMVELICAVAIVSLLGTTVSSMMVVSANSYRRGSAETEVQQETQLVANQIGDLLIDATSSVKMNDTTKTLTIRQDNATKTKIEIALGAESDFLATDLTYKETEDPESAHPTVVGGKAQLLAQNVTSFTCDDSTFETKGYIKVYLTIEKDNHEYPNIFTITTRNAERAEVAQATDGPQVAILAKKWLLEPNQTLDLSVLAEVANGTGSIDWSIETTHDAATVISTDPITNVTSLVISNDEVQPMIKLKAKVGTSEGYINVFIRRVNGLTLEGRLISGTNYKANAVYKLDPTFAGTSLNKIEGAVYDADYDLYMPRDFALTVEGSARSKIEFIDTYTFRIKEDWVGGDAIKITCVAKHPGGANKTGIAYDSISDYWELQSGILNLPIWWESNFRRGADSKVHVEYANVYDFVKNMIKEEFLSGGNDLRNKVRWYARFKSEFDTDWSIYHKMNQDEFTNFKVNAGETYYYRLDENYQIDVAAIICDEATKTIYWPIDTQLLTQGFSTAEGWHFDDSKAIRTPTAKAEYSQVLNIAAAKVAFTNAPDTNKFVLGSIASPVVADKDQQKMIGMEKEKSLGISVGDGSAQYKLDVANMQVYDSLTNRWIAASDFSKSKIETQSDNMNVKFTNRGAEPGIYRAGVYVTNYSYKEIDPTSVLNFITGHDTTNSDWKEGPAYSFNGADAGGYIIFEVLGNGATPRPTATPSPTPTATPEPTAVPEGVATPEPTATPAPTATPGPSVVNCTATVEHVNWGQIQALVWIPTSVFPKDHQNYTVQYTVKFNKAIATGSDTVTGTYIGNCDYNQPMQLVGFDGIDSLDVVSCQLIF